MGADGFMDANDEGAVEDRIKLNDTDAALLGLPQTTSVKIEQWRAGMSD